MVDGWLAWMKSWQPSANQTFVNRIIYTSKIGQPMGIAQETAAGLVILVQHVVSAAMITLGAQAWRKARHGGWEPGAPCKNIETSGIPEPPGPCFSPAANYPTVADEKHDPGGSGI